MKKRIYSTVLSISFLALSSCGVFERHPDSGYNAHLSRPTLKRTDSGTGQETQRIETKTRLKQLENGIQTRKELEQYSRVLPYLRDHNERIYFLSLPGYEARQQWLKDNSINSRTLEAQDNYRDLVDAQDIGVGMTQAMVKKSWGEPENVEVSGNPQFKNERWRYGRYVSTPDGYKMEKKLVYFEGGRVVAWEIE